MKKYHQLLLLLLSIISVSLFLVYRHEYNRLHYVLEVFNFFGQPCNFSDLEKSDFIIKVQDWGPTPAWQRTEYGYVYSAFLTESVTVKAIVVQSDAKLVPKSCYLWYEDGLKPVNGRFNYSILAKESNENLTAFLYNCYLGKNDDDSMPYAVSFSFKEKRRDKMKKILLVNTINHNLSLNTTICVLPSSFGKKKLIEFFSFHKLIGINSYIFYNKDVPHRLSKLMQNLSNKLNAETTFLPWNAPWQDSALTKAIIENDCSLRTFGQSKYVITLDMNDYIVPKYVESFESFLSHFEDDVLEIKFPVTKFCVTNIDRNEPIALQNARAYKSYDSLKILKRNVKNEGIVVNGIVTSEAFVHRYVKCDDSLKGTVVDMGIMRFREDFIRSSLVQLLLRNKL